MPHTTPPAVQAIVSNPVRTRQDMIQLLHSLLTPLHGSLSSGGARVQLGHTGTHFDAGAAELEGFARALWGLAPIMASEPDRPEFRKMREDWVRGLAEGSEVGGDEYWGDCASKDQRFVEMAAIGFAVSIAPKVFWEPLSSEAKKSLNTWLLQANDHPFPDNNWRFFRIFVNLGMKLVGGEYSQKFIDDELDWVDTFYGAHGFPADCPNEVCKAYDYYATSFAIPFYGLIYAHLAESFDPVRAKRFRERALLNVPEVVHLLAPEGECIAFGRSMTYRFAAACFWAGVAIDGLEVGRLCGSSSSSGLTDKLPKPFTWGVIKGLLLRNIRWFTSKEQVFHRDGSLSIGFAYPSLFMSEDYNSPQSPYWALKSFLVLALPESHPFWAAEEEPYPAELLQEPHHAVPAWMQTFTHARGHTYCLSSGQEVSFPMRGAAAKYGKLAYSAQFGFSVPTGPQGLQQVCPDSELVLSDDPEAERWVTRRKVDDVLVSEEGWIRSTWRPWSDVEVVTWLVPPQTTETPYHTRIHKISTGRPLTAADGGFAIKSHTGPSNLHERRLDILDQVGAGTHAAARVNGHANGSAKSHKHGRYESVHSAVAVSAAGVSGVINVLSSTPNSSAKVQDADGNSNLIHPRTVIPLLLTSIPTGSTTWLASRVFALPAQQDKPLDASWADEWTELEGKTYKNVQEVFREAGISPEDGEQYVAN